MVSNGRNNVPCSPLRPKNQTHGPRTSFCRLHVSKKICTPPFCFCSPRNHRLTHPLTQNPRLLLSRSYYLLHLNTRDLQEPNCCRLPMPISCTRPLARSLPLRNIDNFPIELIPRCGITRFTCDRLCLILPIH